MKEAADGRPGMPGGLDESSAYLIGRQEDDDFPTLEIFIRFEIMFRWKKVYRLRPQGFHIAPNEREAIPKRDPYIMHAIAMLEG